MSDMSDRVLKEIHDLEQKAFCAGYEEGFSDGVKSKEGLDKHSKLGYIIRNWIKSIKERNK